MTGGRTTRVLLVRHGTTAGNLEKRYIGARSDEGLCAVGVRELEAAAPLFAAVRGDCRLFTSPARRCLESAAILFPGLAPTIVAGLREIDFGDFEGKNWRELSSDPRYQAWLDSGGTLPFPGGESREAFIRRGVDAFRETVATTAASGGALAAIVCHGGTIMAVLSALTGSGYFDFQVAPGHGYDLTIRTTANEFDLVSYARVDDRLRP